jgi:hypothetical protein
MNKTCALLILNYNGAELLKKCLPSLINDANIPNTGNEVVIIDNKSTDDSKKIVLNEFPEVKWFEASANRFLISYNEYLKICKHPYVFLLNNDVILRKGCVNTLLNKFDDQSVFSVAPFVLNPGDIPENGRTKLYWSSGRFFYKVVDYKTGLTATASTAAGMYDREKLVSMGGFDDLLFPMYGEEMDLTIRAYRRGWIVLFEPSSIVDHIGGATINKKVMHYERRASLVKNRHLSMIKHIHNKFRLSEYFFWTILVMPFRLISFDKGYLLGTIRAIKQFKQASLKRKIEKQSAKITDKMLFKKLSSL